jgi:hypothetical protein
MTQESPEQHAKTEALSRRGMLRYGAFAAAAAAGAAGSAALATPASAAAGDPVAVDGTVTGTAVTKITGSSLDVTGSNGDAGNGVQKAAIVGRSSAAVGTGVVGIGTGAKGAGIVALNPGGPQLQIGVSHTLPNPADVTPGAIVNYDGSLYQAFANGTNPFWIPVGGAPILSLQVLPQPVRVYASSKDTTRGGAKIGRGEVRHLDVTKLPNSDVTSGIPPWAQAVVGTVQLEATEQTSGYVAIGSGDISTPTGFSTAAWSSAAFSGVTGFSSGLGTSDNTYGTLSIVCQGNNAAAKTHFYIDIVGYYEYDIKTQGESAAKAAGQAKTMARLGAQHKRALRKN